MLSYAWPLAHFLRNYPCCRLEQRFRFKAGKLCVRTVTVVSLLERLEWPEV